MARTVEAVSAELVALLPPGDLVWRRARQADSNFARALRPLADGMQRFEAAAEAQLVEVDPRTAAAMLTDYERVLGPDPCGRDGLDLSFGDRQRVAWQRWVAPAGQTPAFYIALAAGLGTTITIAESRLFEMGESQMGDELMADGEQFVWVVKLDSTRLTDFETGDAEMGDALGDFAINLVECAIRASAPAHTAVVFDYSGTFVLGVSSLGYGVLG